MKEQVERLANVAEELLWLDSIYLLSIAQELDMVDDEMMCLDEEEFLETLFLKCFYEDKLDELQNILQQFYKGQWP